jgi:hypothetical protein
MSEPIEIKPSNMVDVMKYFDMKPAEFKAEWSKMTDKDKADLKRWLDELRGLITNDD